MTDPVDRWDEPLLVAASQRLDRGAALKPSNHE